MQKLAYTVKIYDPERRSKFTLRELAKCAEHIYHELEDEIPDGDYNVGYFEGSQHKMKWLVSSADLVAMYTHFKGKKEIP